MTAWTIRDSQEMKRSTELKKGIYIKEREETQRNNRHSQIHIYIYIYIYIVEQGMEARSTKCRMHSSPNKQHLQNKILTHHTYSLIYILYVFFRKKALP